MKDYRVKMRNMSDVIRELTMEVNDPDGQLTSAKLANMARSCYDELNLFVFPNIVVVELDALSNLTINMPGDTVRPLRVEKIKLINGKKVPLLFGKLDNTKPQNPLVCEEDPGEDNFVLGDLVSEDRSFLTISPYGERYGERRSRFFGWWNYDPSYNRMELTGALEGDTMRIWYHSENEDYKKVPIDIIPAFRNYILQRHWAGSDPRLANYYYGQFRIAMKNYKKFKLDGFTLEDWLDAFTSEYSSVW